jgi:hypothetical protein
VEIVTQFPRIQQYYYENVGDQIIILMDMTKDKFDYRSDRTLDICICHQSIMKEVKNISAFERRKLSVVYAQDIPYWKRFSFLH